MKASEKLERRLLDRRLRYVAIGTSAGGVDALLTLLPLFKKPSDLSVLFVLHLPASGPNLIPSLLSDRCDFVIKEAESGEAVLPETIYMAPPDYHLSLETNGTVSLSTEELVNFSRPSIDVLFESVAHAAKDQALGILLTGANEDGARGLKLIHDRKGVTIVQDPGDADFPTMPAAALAYIEPDLTVSLEELKEVLGRLFGPRSFG